jgi:phosphatidate cytidylyltransferase
MIIALVVMSSVAMISNLYEGIIWILLPFLLIITNNVLLQIFSLLFGKNKP